MKQTEKALLICSLLGIFSFPFILNFNNKNTTCDYLLNDKKIGKFYGTDLPCNLRINDTIKSGQKIIKKF